MPEIRRPVLKLYARVVAQLAKRSRSENAFLFLLPVVGLLVGLTSVGMAHLISLTQELLWGDGGSLSHAVEQNPWPLRILIPIIGGLLVGLVGWLFRVQTRGGGITTIIQSIALRNGHLSLRQTLPRDATAVITLGAGGSLGREGAMAMLAAAVGSALGRHFKLTPQQLRMLVCAAAAAALAAVYNAPIGGALFALEVFMGNFALEVFGPVVVTSVIATLVFRSMMGDLPRFEAPRYELVSGWELPLYVGLGVLAGIASLLVVRALFSAQDVFEKLPVPNWLKPAIGLGMVGAIGVWYPHVFGNGFEAVNLTLQEQFPVQLLAMLFLMKLVATALSFGAGASGGLFTPSLMIGALLGGVYGYGVHHLFPTVTAEHGAYALVAMGGLLAGTTHAPLTAVMMIFEQTNSYQIVLPLMLVCVISHLTTKLLRVKALDDEALKRQGIVLPRGIEGSVMQTLLVGDVMHAEVVALPHTAPFRAVVETFLREPHNNLYVVDDQGKFLGAIRLHALKEMLSQGETLPSVVAHDLLDDSFAFVTPDARLADTMDKFWQQNSERLPVVNNPVDRRLIGWMSKRDIIGVYSQEVLSRRQLLGHFITNEGDKQRDVLVELPEGFEVRTVTLPAHCSGKTVAQLALRSAYGVHVLSVRQRDPTTGQDVVSMPTPSLILREGDRMTVIGQFEGIAQLMAAMATGAI